MAIWYGVTTGGKLWNNTKEWKCVNVVCFEMFCWSWCSFVKEFVLPQSSTFLVQQWLGTRGSGSEQSLLLLGCCCPSGPFLQTALVHHAHWRYQLENKKQDNIKHLFLSKRSLKSSVSSPDSTWEKQQQDLDSVRRQWRTFSALGSGTP